MGASASSTFGKENQVYMESSDNAKSPSQPRQDTEDSDAESSEDEVIFKHPSRGGEIFSNDARIYAECCGYAKGCLC